MKRLVQRLLAAIFLSMLCYGGPIRAQILVGPQAGGQLSWVSFQDKDLRDEYSVRPVWGFNAGANTGFRVKDRYYLYTSLVYSTKGKVINGKLDHFLSNQVQYRYIDMPITYAMEFRQRVGRAKTYQWFVGAGPNLSYWLSGKGTFFNSDLHELFRDPLTYTIRFKGDPGAVEDNKMNVEDPSRFQLGLNFMGGVIVQPWGYERFVVTLKYELGHSFLSRTSDGLFPNVTSYRDVLKTTNQGLRLSVGYMIDLRTSENKKGSSVTDSRQKVSKSKSKKQRSSRPKRLKSVTRKRH